MGLYINPPFYPKEVFIQKYATRVPQDQVSGWKHNQSSILLCLVTNPAFTALAVVYDQRELDVFTRADDRRRREYYVTDRENFVHSKCGISPNKLESYAPSVGA